MQSSDCCWSELIGYESAMELLSGVLLISEIIVCQTDLFVFRSS